MLIHASTATERNTTPRLVPEPRTDHLACPAPFRALSTRARKPRLLTASLLNPEPSQSTRLCCSCPTTPTQQRKPHAPACCSGNAMQNSGPRAAATYAILLTAPPAARQHDAGCWPTSSRAQPPCEGERPSGAAPFSSVHRLPALDVAPIHRRCGRGLGLARSTITIPFTSITCSCRASASSSSSRL